jgi:hypothetical protein
MILIAIGVLGIALMPAGAQARTWYVPGDVATVTEAIELAGTDDTIVIAAGVYKIVGDGYRLADGLTIRSDMGIPGSVILTESDGNWPLGREQPVFIVQGPGGATAPVTFEGITFRDFTHAYGPNQFVAEPIINVRSGLFLLKNCVFDHYFGTAVSFDDGSGDIAHCAFVRGHGRPAAVKFSGAKLQLNDCGFRENTQRFPGDFLSDGDKLPGSVLRLVSGEVYLGCGLFEENGPIVYLVNVEEQAILRACETCMTQNSSLWQGRVAGRVRLTCCEIDRSRWLIVNDGSVEDDDDELDRYHELKAMSTRNTSWTRIKSLFD